MAEDQDQDNNVISLQIPEGTETGDVLTFVVNGQSLELAVPPESEPGDVLEIQLGDTTKITTTNGGERNKNDDTSAENTMNTADDSIKHNSNSSSSSNVVSIPLVAVQNQVLKLATSLPMETKKGNTDIHRSSSNANNNTNTTSDGTNAMAWPAGLEMARYFQTSRAKANFQKLCKPSDTNNNLEVLELGSGLGLVGMAFATEILGILREQAPEATPAATSTTTAAPSSTVVLTDTDLALPLLQYNMDQNKHVMPPNVQITAESLMWGNTPFTKNKKYDWIIGSDVLYNVSSIPKLITTIQDYLDPHYGRMILGVRWRKPNEERQFFELLSDHSDLQIEWRLLQSPKGCHTVEWQHYGNANSNEWTHYSNTTMIAIQGGQPKSLNLVTEEDLPKMTNDESKAWESAQIQIYLGTATTAVVDSDEESSNHEHITKRPRFDKQ